MDDAEQVAAFVAAADALHLGRAAATLGLTRATIARRLRALESRLGLCLIDRRHRCRISVTQAGVALLPDARQLVAAATRLAITAREIQDGRVGVVRVGLISEPAEAVDAVIEPLRQVDPGWSVDVRRMDRWAARREMAIGGLEVVVGHQVAPVPTGPGPVASRPSRHERTRGLRIGAGAPGWVDVSWRASWEDVEPLTPGRARSSDAAAAGPTTTTLPSPESGPAAHPSPGSDPAAHPLPGSGPAAHPSPGSGPAAHPLPGSDPAAHPSPESDPAARPPSGSDPAAIPVAAGSPAARASGSAHARVLARTACRLRDDDLDARFPRRAARLRAIAARRAAVEAETELRRRESAELGAEAALARAQERTRADTVRRYRAACQQGGVELHLAIAYWASEGPDALYWATFGADDSTSRPEPDDGSRPP